MLPRRRDILIGFAASAAFSPLLTGAAGAQSSAFTADPTPACADDDDVTISQTEGPYFTPNSPARHDLFEDAPLGQRFSVGGLVLDTDCKPVADALVEIWHADENGDYDNEGFKCRGHVMSDARGVWWFNTVLPGVYPGRTRHFHFKVQRSGGAVLTTQLYFPGEPQNAGDGIFDERLLMKAENSSSERIGRYDFILG